MSVVRRIFWLYSRLMMFLLRLKSRVQNLSILHFNPPSRSLKSKENNDISFYLHLFPSKDILHKFLQKKKLLQKPFKMLVCKAKWCLCFFVDIHSTFTTLVCDEWSNEISLVDYILFVCIYTFIYLPLPKYRASSNSQMGSFSLLFWNDLKVI